MWWRSSATQEDEESIKLEQGASQSTKVFEEHHNEDSNDSSNDNGMWSAHARHEDLKRCIKEAIEVENWAAMKREEREVELKMQEEEELQTVLQESLKQAKVDKKKMNMEK